MHNHSNFAAIAPAKPRVYTYLDPHCDALEFNRRTLGEAYKAVGKHDPTWDAQPAAYLDAIAQQFITAALSAFYKPENSEFTHATALPTGQAVIALGCDDPMVLYCH